MVGYAQTRKDFEYLDSIQAVEDQQDLDADRLYLMQNPTKAEAAKMYLTGIMRWFDEIRNPSVYQFDWDGLSDEQKRKVTTIKKRYAI